MSDINSPGSTIGILGGGQLGRMLATAAKRMGYKIHVLDASPDAPAASVSDLFSCVSFDNPSAFIDFSKRVDLITYEMEHLPLEMVEAISAECPLFPNICTLELSQNRIKEKTYLNQNGIATAPFWILENPTDISEFQLEEKLPCVIKSVSGYDGKGQWKINSTFEWNQYRSDIVDRLPVIVEQWISLDCEISVIAARNRQGQIRLYGPFENQHRDHILDYSICPSNVDHEIKLEAKRVAMNLVEWLQIQGLLCVEFFVTKQKELLVNELAPRPHNSGHLSIEAHSTSQFEQHIRAICGLPLGETHLKGYAAMVNLLGDLWLEGEPQWEKVFAMENVYLHLYGKEQAKPKRKMGHITALSNNQHSALQSALEARNQIHPTHSESSVVR